MNYHFPNTLLVYLHDLLQRYRVLFDLRIVCENDMIKDTPSETELQQVQNTVGGLVVVETDLLDTGQVAQTPINVVKHIDIDSNQSLSRKENTVTEDQDHG